MREYNSRALLDFTNLLYCSPFHAHIFPDISETSLQIKSIPIPQHRVCEVSSVLCIAVGGGFRWGESSGLGLPQEEVPIALCAHFAS